MPTPKKSLGQHWLKDEAALESICRLADLNQSDTILEIGPGLGHLTRRLLARAGKVMAVELDAGLAERLAAPPGQMSLLSVSAQLYYEAELGPVVPAELFEPAPKIDSQVIKLSRRQPPLFRDLDTKLYFRLVKAGF